MAKKKAPIRHNVSTSSPSIPSLSIAEGKKDVIGQRPVLGKVNNNIIYGVGLLAVLGAGYFAYSNPMLIRRLMGQQPPAPGAYVNAPPSVQPGQAVTIQGGFNPPVPQAWYVVTNQTGQQVTSGSLGSNVSSFSQQIPATSLPNGTYTVTVSDSPPTGAAGGPSPGSIAGGGPGQMNTTAATLQQGLSPTGLGPAQSGPESISLS